MTVRATAVQQLGMSARQLRQAFDSSDGVGITGVSDLVASAATGLFTQVTAGRTRMRPFYGSEYRGVYELWNDSITNVLHSAGGANPRIDQIVARVNDSAELGSGSNGAEIAVVQGTATSGATLDNRTGVAALAVNEQLLWDVLVPTSAASAAGFTYRDRRPYASPNMVPRALSGGTVDAVQMQLQQISLIGASLGVAATNYQGAALAYLSRPITATKIRWAYAQQATAATGNYVIGIFDASGRRIVDTGSVAFTGAANSRQLRSETITSTRFEAGTYYVFIGTTIATASSSVTMNGTYVSATAQSLTPQMPGMGLYSTTGGVAVPNTLLAMSDSGVVAAQLMPVPQIALSSV